MTVHRKWELLVQKLLNSVELFTSYGLFGEPLKIAFGLSFFNLCVSRLLVQTTRFVVKYLQKPLTCKAETCSTVHKVPSL